MVSGVLASLERGSLIRDIPDVPRIWLLISCDKEEQGQQAIRILLRYDRIVYDRQRSDICTSSKKKELFHTNKHGEKK